MPVPDQRPPIPLPLPRLPGKRTRLAAARRPKLMKRRRALKKKRAAGDGGFIKKSQTILRHGDSSKKFNIVILGDGFAVADMPVFDTYALLVKKALTTGKPFASLANRINVHKVSVVSTDSGISNCPTCGSAMLKDTYFKTTGCWNGSPSGTFVGTASSERIYDAVETVIPQHDAHLVVTIVNCRHYGGSAPPELGMVFLTLPDLPVHTKKMFINLAKHESAHVIAKLCEEYNPCNKRDPLRSYPNEATQAELDAGTVSWKHLALPSELDAKGQFKVIHRHGDPKTAACQPALTAAKLRSLGAFWGCHNGSPPRTAADTTPLDRCDARGKPFYRAMADCRMRNIQSEFCRVCSSLISEHIKAVSV
jgi:hypothetical protein